MVTLFKKSLPLFIFFSFLTLFIHHLSRDVFGGDVGDLVTAGCVGGIPHPSGYPLFSFLAFFLCKFHGIFSQPAVFWVGLISSFSGAGSLVLYYLLSLRVSKNLLASLFGVLTLGFSYLFWLYSEIAEVFMLNIFFALLLFFLAYLYKEKQKLLYLFLFCFFFGLSLTNHHTIVLLFPSYLILLISSLKQIEEKLKVASVGSLFFFLGFSVYSYVFFATLHTPPVLWEKVTDVESFLSLLLRVRYGTFSSGGFAAPELMELFVILKTYFLTLLSQFSIFGLLLSLIGIDSLIRKDKILSLSYGVALIITGPLFMGYAGFPLSSAFHMGVSERFVLLSTVVLSLFLPFGYESVIRGIKRLLRTKSLLSLFILMFFFLPTLLFFQNVNKTNLSVLRYGDQLGKNLLVPLPPSSILLLWGDTTLFNTWYVHYVLGVRKDITIINIVDITTSSLFDREYSKVKKMKKNDTVSEETADTLLSLDKTRPVFSLTSEISPENKFSWVPYGVVFELKRNEEPSLSLEEFKERTNALWSQIRLPDIRYTKTPAAQSLTIQDLPLTYANSLTMHGKYLFSTYKDGKEAIRLYDKALLVDPTYAEAYAAKGVVLANSQKCNEAEKVLFTSLRLVPHNKTYYQQIGSLYQTCLKDSAKFEQIAKLYKDQFGADLEKEIREEIKKRSKK